MIETVKIPQSLHWQLSKQAEENGVDLETYLVSVLAMIAERRVVTEGFSVTINGYAAAC